MEELFFAMIPITLFLTIGGVLILRPLTKRLGLLLEANAASKRSTEIDRMQYDHLRTLLEAQNLKIETLEQRLEFTEGLLDGRRAQVGIPGGGPMGPGYAPAPRS